MSEWKFLDSGSNIAAYNMAMDEELLARAQAGERMPVLRFYGWDPPAVSLGRFQKLGSSVNADICIQLGIDIVRRVTGGRAVLHNKELTYSIICRTDHPLFPNSVHGTYKVIATGLVQGLKNLGIQGELVSRDSRHAPMVETYAKDPSCFSSPSWYEIVVNGRKIIGSAQRRLSGAFLQHGSILIDHDRVLEARVIPGAGSSDCLTCINRELGRSIPFAEIKQAFHDAFASALNISYDTHA